MIRIVKKYAWTPKQVHNKLIWLKPYESIEMSSLVEDFECHDCTNPLSPCDGHKGRYHVWAEIGRRLA